jgi:RsiW-degrading membrane proteinase PrsW (M82 family)
LHLDYFGYVFFYNKDKFEPEPKSFIIKIFFLGILLVFPVVLIQIPLNYLSSYLPDYLIELIFTCIIAPIIEEFSKYLVVRWTVYRHAEFDEPVDGIIYGVTVALGFASLENVAYLLNVYRSSEGWVSEAVLVVFIVRALFSVPGHALWSSLWGYGLGIAKFSNPEIGNKAIRKGLIQAIFSHGIFNAFMSLHPLAGLGALFLIPFGFRVTFRKIAKTLALSPYNPHS